MGRVRAAQRGAFCAAGSSKQLLAGPTTANWSSFSPTAGLGEFGSAAGSIPCVLRMSVALIRAS